jgi:hypothetical protein
MWVRFVSFVAVVLLVVGSVSAAGAAIEEYDAVLRDWKQGQTLGLQHSLFSLYEVGAGHPNSYVILFKGKSGGVPGTISLQFFTQEGDVLHAPQGSLYFPSVGGEKRDFTVGGIVPQQLRGKCGLVQVTFQGRSGERAAFYLKVYF